MTFTFTCQNCDDTFEVDYETLGNGRGLKCEECGKRLPAGDVEEFVTSLDELLARVGALRKRFGLTFEVDAEDLPPGFDADARRGRDEDDEEEDDEDDDDVDDGDEDESYDDADEDDDR
jgi:DNA-directed RNA polymerase subunit RPC12/RpoP